MAQFKLLRHDAIIDLGYSCTQCVLEQHKKLKTLKNVKPSVSVCFSYTLI